MNDEKNIGQLVQVSKLNLLEQLASGISHELVNLLASIRLAADEIEFQSRSFTEPIQRDLKLPMGALQRNIARMSETVDQIQKIIRRPEDKFEPVDMHDVLKGLEKLAKRIIGRSSIHFALELKAQDANLWANRGQLEQLFLNLVSNSVQAIQASSKGSKITFSTREEGRSIEVTVSDDGPGIPEEHLSQIFDPFFTTKGSGQGIGLGLTMAAQIMKVHAGDIRVESKIGEGARFHLIFPKDRREVKRS